MYYAEKTHESIIDAELFEAVQAEIDVRAESLTDEMKETGQRKALETSDKKLLNAHCCKTSK